MKSFMLSLFLVALSLSSAAFCSEMSQQSNRIQWFVNYEEGAKVASQTSKPMVLLFTGSDWCGACRSLESQVLSSRDFIQANADKYVFVKVDFPRSKPQDPREKAQNNQLQRKFNIQAYPTIVVLDSRESFLGTVNHGGGVQQFTAQLNSLTRTQSAYR